MKLHLLRHAKTNQSSSTGRDFDRKLLPKGINQSQALGTFLGPYIKDVEIWCSDASRTKETLSIIQKYVSLSKPKFLKQLYLASRDEILDMLWNNESDRDLLIIGHNYGISDVASYFLDEHIELKTGGYIVIDFDIDSWEESSRGLGTKIIEYRPEVD